MPLRSWRVVSSAARYDGLWFHVGCLRRASSFFAGQFISFTRRGEEIVYNEDGHSAAEHQRKQSILIYYMLRHIKAAKAVSHGRQCCRMFGYCVQRSSYYAACILSIFDV